MAKRKELKALKPGGKLRFKLPSFTRPSEFVVQQAPVTVKLNGGGHYVEIPLLKTALGTDHYLCIEGSKVSVSVSRVSAGSIKDFSDLVGSLPWPETIMRNGEEYSLDAEETFEGPAGSGTYATLVKGAVYNHHDDDFDLWIEVVWTGPYLEVFESGSLEPSDITIL